MRCVLLAVSACAVTAAGQERFASAASLAAEPKPLLLKPEGQEFTLLKNWTFGNKRPDATVRNKAGLDQEFFYRYIWENGKLDKFKTYWSYHRDYPEGDPKSLHVFSDNTLTLKGRVPPGGGLHERGIESGMLRAKLPVRPGMYLEMRAKLPGGVGVWPSFWLEQGVEYPEGIFSPPSKALSEIDVFEFFNWDGRPQTRIITCNVQTFGKAAAHGNPHDIFTLLKDAGYERHLDVGVDCSKDFHVFALDWVENKPIWLLDGKPIKQTCYEWQGPAAHVTVVNSIGMNLPGVKQTQMVADEKRWDYAIDYIRVWERKAGAINIPISSPANLAKAPDAPKAPDTSKSKGRALTIAANGKWQSPVISASPADVAKLKANPLLKVDITVPPDTDDAGWFMVKLAINGQGIERTESPKWLLDRRPGKAGIDKLTLFWDASEVVARLPDDPNWFKIELVNQGDRPRTITVSNVRAQGVADHVNAVALKVEAPAVAAEPKSAVDGPKPYPDPKNEAAWPGKGVIRSFGFMVGERQAFWTNRPRDQGAVVFVGDSLTGGWKNLAKDFPKLKVANRGVGGDVSRGALFRFKQDVLALNPKAVVIEIGNNDLTAMGAPADMLAMAEKDKPGMPVVLCSIPPSANPKAPVKPESRKAMNEGIRKMASEHKNAHFCDLYTALANADGAPKPEYFADDKLHMNDAGHIKWAELLTPLFEKLKLE